MLSIIYLKIVVGIGHEALQLAGEQQVSHDCAGVVGGFLVSTIANGDGEMLHGRGSLELKRDSLEGLVFTLQTCNGDGIYIVIMMIDKEEAIGQKTAVLVENNKIIDTRRKKRGIKGDTSATSNGLERLQHATAKDGHSKVVI